MNIEIYTGKYKEQLKGSSTVIDMKGDYGLSIVRPYLGVSRDGESQDNRIHLIVKDDEGSKFWPVIIRLTEDEAVKLRDAIETAIVLSPPSEAQFVEQIENEEQ